MGMKDHSAKDYEDIIKKINDVLDCRVSIGEDNNVEEINVVARTGRSPKYVIRDVESAILAASGEKIDKGKISIVQMTDTELAFVARPKLVGIELMASGSSAVARVRLALGGVVSLGESEGIATATRWNWFCAEATVNALSHFLKESVNISLRDVNVYESRSLRTALVVLGVIEDGRELTLTGSCPVSYDEREAVVKATLDAVNRRFPRLMANA
ncbi:MAG TPA: hypothetical protein PLK53_00320 [Bacillota bacterium]|jgi:hypothetical protein|nr:hypothetical protein [Bacillota bacterium]HOV65506.1 hypothetical protein [Bacillota bacterium]HRC52937.1 hypothetical protein [Bacillota bacterium]